MSLHSDSRKNPAGSIELEKYFRAAMDGSRVRYEIITLEMFNRTNLRKFIAPSMS